MLPNWYLNYKKLIDNSVEEYLTEYFKSEKNSWLNTIKEASIYACKWWKRIRSILALEFYLVFTKPPLAPPLKGVNQFPIKYQRWYNKILYCFGIITCL